MKVCVRRCKLCMSVSMCESECKHEPAPGGIDGLVGYILCFSGLDDVTFAVYTPNTPWSSM